MSQSSAYPIFLGRAIALEFHLIWTHTEGRHDKVLKEFAEQMVKSLPPAGTLLPEVGLKSKLFSQLLGRILKYG